MCTYICIYIYIYIYILSLYLSLYIYIYPFLGAVCIQECGGEAKPKFMHRQLQFGSLGPQEDGCILIFSWINPWTGYMYGYIH